MGVAGTHESYSPLAGADARHPNLGSPSLEEEEILGRLADWQVQGGGGGHLKVGL